MRTRDAGATRTLIVHGSPGVARRLPLGHGRTRAGRAGPRRPRRRDRHEEWGTRTRNVFGAIAVLELAALAMMSRRRLAQGLRVVSALAGLGGLFVLYEASEHGGELVYIYAGGVGIRSGAQVDVKRLLVAGLYHRSRIARGPGRRPLTATLTSFAFWKVHDGKGIRPIPEWGGGQCGGGSRQGPH